MTKQTRRNFLRQAPAYAALATLPGITAACADPISAQSTKEQVISTTALPDINLNGPIVAYINTLSSGEVSLFYDTQEYVFRDPELVQRLLKAVR